MAGQEALSPVPKRARTNGSREHRIGSTYNVTGLQLTDHTLTVPLDHTGASAAERQPHAGHDETLCACTKPPHTV